MNYTITLLAENTTYRHNVLAQHGQSILIESDTQRLLFDVGEVPGAVTHNLTQLGLQISDIAVIAISHRHIDHIGALVEMLEDMGDQRLLLPMQLGEPDNKPAKESYSFLTPNPDGGYDVGISREHAERITAYRHSETVTGGFEVIPGIFTTGCIGDQMKEQAMVIDQKETGITVITGCSHPGVHELITEAVNVTGNSRIRGVIGGFHFTDMTDDEIREHAIRFQDYGLEFLVPGHCTTVRGAQILQNVLGELVKLSKTATFGTGNSLSLTKDSIKWNFV
ncbi:MAG: Ribonuclease BN [candidate division WS6 bacterium OLB20]|uniref:Ribonuclease BN n=1 Tax=candidate division WS6 bacterium OLB20 TaxID=1617426 RepID=A0A136M0N8_9BACT|nr:MAG: Ribonuclease BN [candidate division WS6 bacterium OLB20]